MPIQIQSAQRAVAPKREQKSVARTFGRSSGRIGGQERMFFTERLALLLETGSPLHVSLETLERQAPREALQKVIRELGQDVSQGLSFSQALAKQPEAFDASYVNLIAAGETGGFLPEILQRLREMDEKRQELTSTLLTAFSYPAFLMVFSCFVVIFILTVVFPKFAPLFATIADQLPGVTLFLMGASEALRSYWLPGLAVIGATAALFWRWVRSAQGVARMDRLLLRTPVIREIIIQLHLVQFMHVMSLSLSHGVPMLDALRSCREIARSISFRQFIEGLEVRVNEGGGISSGFQEGDLLPALVPQMIATGEETGRLAMVTGRVADFYEREWRKKLTVFSKVAEPLMLVVMGVVVGLLVSSLILPIFKLSRIVH